MGQVTLTIAGRDYSVACHDGEEAHLARLGAMIDAKASSAGNATAGVNEARRLLFAALLIADELVEAQARPALPSGTAQTIERLAMRVEALCSRLENSAHDA